MFKAQSWTALFRDFGASMTRAAAELVVNIAT